MYPAVSAAYFAVTPGSETFAYTVFTALSDLRASVNEDLTTRGANLPSLTTVRLTMTMPALLASWRLYGSTDRAAAIVSRNHVCHPGRVPGGVDLEVLRD